MTEEQKKLARRIEARSELVERLVLEMGAGILEPGDMDDSDIGQIASEAIMILCGAIVGVANHNSNPKKILDKVGAFFDEQIRGVTR